MSDIDKGGSAFPINPPIDGDGRSAAGYPEPEGGMTLRDYFAAKFAMSIYEKTTIYSVPPDGSSRLYQNDFCQTAATAYELADAMLKARKS